MNPYLFKQIIEKWEKEDCDFYKECDECPLDKVCSDLSMIVDKLNMEEE